MRVLVTGNAGSGKSTLAKRIAAGLELPLFGLDTIVWQEGWKKTRRHSSTFHPNASWKLFWNVRSQPYAGDLGRTGVSLLY